MTVWRRRGVENPNPAPARPKGKTFEKEVAWAEIALQSTHNASTVQVSLENMTAKLVTYITAAASWTTKKNAVTAIRDIVHAIVCTEGHMGRHLKCAAGSYELKLNFIKAVQRLSEAEKARLRTDDGGAWLRGLELSKHDSRRYGGIMAETRLEEMIAALLKPRSVDSGDDEDLIKVESR